MKILLLDITGFSLERDISLSTIDEHFTSDDTHSNSGSQDIEQGGFPSTRDTHEGGQSTRLDPTVDVIQNSSFFLFDLDVIDDVLPTENGSLSLDYTVVDFAFFVFRNITGLDGTVGVFAALGVRLVLVLESSWNLALLEDEDFTL